MPTLISSLHSSRRLASFGAGRFRRLISRLPPKRVRGVVVDIDAKNELAPQREVEILGGIRGQSIAETLAALEELDDQNSRRMSMRKIATHLVAEIDGRGRDVAKAETERNEARKPFEAKTRRAREYALRVAEAPKLFKQVVSQFRADIEIAKLGKAAWSRTPPPKGTHVGYEQT